MENLNENCGLGTNSPCPFIRGTSCCVEQRPIDKRIIEMIKAGSDGKWWINLGGCEKAKGIAKKIKEKQ